MTAIIDQNNVFKVFAGSAELSPFHQCYANSETVLRNCAGRLFPHYNGEDITSCYWALRKKAALFDVPERPIEVSGNDSLPFLNMIFTRELSTLAINRGRYVLACSSSGGLFMDAVIFRLCSNRFWIVQPDGYLSTWLEAHKTDYDVRISDPNSRVLQIQGPKSFQIINQLSDGLVDKNFGYFHSGFFNIGGQDLYVSRTGWTGELGYEIYTQGEKTNPIKLWRDLTQTGEEVGLQFSSMQAMNIRRIEAGILDSGSDFDLEMNPFEAGLGKFVDLTKNNFIGQQALHRGNRKKRLFGILSNGFAPRRGYTIVNKNGVVGMVTTGAYSPQLNAGIGYVKFPNAFNIASGELKLRSDLGDEVDFEMLDPPFYDEGKRIPREL